MAWRINEEPWLRNSDILNNLKLRLGWGQIGNDKIGDNAFLQTIFNSGPTFVGYPFGINPEIAAGATVLTTSIRAASGRPPSSGTSAVDFGLWNNKLTGTVDLFLRDTKDMLLSVTAPAHVATSTPRRPTSERSATRVSRSPSAMPTASVSSTTRSTETSRSSATG